MKNKIILLMVIALMLLSVFNISAKVTYEKGDDGFWYAVVTNSSYKDLRQLNITGTFQKWEKPGIPMYRNKDGIWEIKLKMDVPKIIYKFYNPDVEGDAAYLDDTENPEKTANPFGSFDYVLRKPKDSGGGSSDASSGGKVKGPSDTVWYEKGADGFWYAVVINRTYKNLRQLNITGTFQKWVKPGVPMYKNADGNWEIKLKMDVPKIIYKFYNPDVEGDAAYLDDTENPDKTANPFGSFDYVLRRPKESATTETSSGGGGEDEEYNPRVGLWSRTYYWNTVKSDLTMQVNKTTDGTVSLELKNTDKENKDLDKRVWRGENGSQKGESQRIWYSSAVFYTSATIKVHGKMMKNFAIDIEWNAQGKFQWEYDKYWDSDNADGITNYYVNELYADYKTAYPSKDDFKALVARYVSRYLADPNNLGNDPDDTLGIGTVVQTKLIKELDDVRVTLRNKFLTEAARDGASKGFEIFFRTAPTMYNDQLVFNFEYPDLDVRIGIWACKYFKSRDPLRFVVGDVIGSKDYESKNLEFYIHPTKVAGLNIDIGISSSTFKDKRWTFYINADYDILGKGEYKIGLVQTMGSYSPEAVSMFNNAIYLTSLYAIIKPKAIAGLLIEGQLAIQYDTRYMNAYNKDSEYNDDANTIPTVLSNGYDFFANSVIYLKGEYNTKSILSGFKIGYAFYGVGAQIKAMMSKNSPIASNKDDTFNSGFATPNEINYDKSGNAIGKIINVLDFSINPIKDNPKLLMINYYHEFAILDLYSPMKALGEQAEVDSYNDKKETFTMTNVFNPSINMGFKAGNLDLSLKVGATFALYTKHANDINAGKGLDGNGNGKEYITGNYFTFNKAVFALEIDKISDVLKKIGFDYSLKFVYFEPYWETDSTKFDKNFVNWIQYKKFINQLIMTMNFKNDITLQVGYVFRYYHGEPTDKWIFYVPSDKNLLASYNLVPEYFNWGLAFGFTYVIPYKAINEPVLFANFCLGWDPFKIGDLSTSMATDRREDGSGLDEQSSFVTVGIKWDF